MYIVVIHDCFIAWLIMDIVLSTEIKRITHQIDFDPKSTTNGKTLSVSHVQRLEEWLDENASVSIQGSIVRQTSVTLRSLRPYTVTLKLNPARHVVDASCSCVSKSVKECEHMYAIIHYINNDQTERKTSVKQAREKSSDRQLDDDTNSKPKRVRKDKKIVTSKKVASLADSKPAARGRLRENNRNATEIIPKEIKIIIDKIDTLLKVNDCRTCVSNLVDFAEKYKTYTCNSAIGIKESNKNFYSEKVVLTKSAIVELCVLTEKQADCQEWFVARKMRISATKGHRIKARTSKPISSLLHDFFYSRNFKNSAMDYGNENESVAVAEYERRYDVSVVHVGLVVSLSQPWLCASPDGVVVADGNISKILEIKCPMSCMNKPIFNAKTGTCNVPYLYVNDETVELKSSHQYYTQIQIQMYVSGVSECDLYVWSPKGSTLVNVRRDETFLENVIPMLESFYFKHYLKVLSDIEKENDNA